MCFLATLSNFRFCHFEPFSRFAASVGKKQALHVIAKELAPKGRATAAISILAAGEGLIFLGGAQRRSNLTFGKRGQALDLGVTSFGHCCDLLWPVIYLVTNAFLMLLTFLTRRLTLNRRLRTVSMPKSKSRQGRPLPGAPRTDPYVRYYLIRLLP